MDEKIHPPTASSGPSEPIYHSVVDQEIELICRRTPDGTLTFVNEAYCHYYGFPEDELLGRRFMPLIPEEDRRKMEQTNSLLTPENPLVTYEHRTLSTHPEPRWLQWVKYGIYDGEGNLLECQYIGRDITDQKLAEEELRLLSTHDPVTNLFNLSFFHAEMERLERGRMFPVSILLCLVDVSSAPGKSREWPVRERVLEQTAQMLRCAFRAEDIIARIQDGLFGVLLPTTESKVASNGLERLRKCLETQKRLDGSVTGYRLGTATGDKGTNLTDLLRRAEQNLFEQKPV